MAESKKEDRPGGSLRTNTETQHESLNDEPAPSNQLMKPAAVIDAANDQGATAAGIDKGRSGGTINAPKAFDASKQEITRSSKKGQLNEQQIEVTANSEQNVNAPESPKQLKDLPDVPFREIFGNFETHEQLLIRGVCRRWQILVEGLLSTTKSLKLELAPANPNVSLSYRKAQFNNNWNKPALDKMAKLSIREGEFKRASINMILRLFANAEVLVINFNLEATKRNVNALTRMIRKFPNLKSLSIIRTVMNAVDDSSDSDDSDEEEGDSKVYMLKDICISLTKMKCKLTRLDLHLFSKYEKFGKFFPWADFVKIFASIEHFTIRSWPITVVRDHLVRIYSNLGSGEKQQQQQQQQQQQAISIKSLSLEEKTLGLFEVFRSNAQFGNVQRLQLNNIIFHEHVEGLLGIFPQLESLELDYFINSPTYNFSNTQLDLINKLSKLTELKVWSSFEKYQEGPTAPNIIKLTICKNDLFNCLLTENGHDIFEDNFVDIIVHKFPSLEQLTLLNYNLNGRRQKSSERIRADTRRMLSIKLPKLKFTVIDV